MDIEDIVGSPIDYRTANTELPEDLYQPLYDTVSVVKGDMSIDFFKIPYGYRDQVLNKIKTKIHTNMDCPSVCPLKMHTLTDIFLKVKPRNIEILSWLVIHGGFKCSIIDKVVLEMPLIEWFRWNTQYEDRIQYAMGMPAICIQPYENFSVVISLDESWPFENVGVYFSFQTIMRRPT